MLSACVVGNVKDATNKAAISGHTVIGVGLCDGLGCSSSTYAYTETDGLGVYAFDPYPLEDAATNAEAVYLQPAEGKETIGLLVADTGYYAQWVYHVPNYQQNASGNAYTQVPEVFLTPVGQWVDSDGDGLSDLEEARYGTDPHNADTDDDSLSDLIETRGTNWINLRDRGASPLRKDVFVECDYMPGFRPLTSSIDTVVEAFRTAPTSNPDGSTGITLHVDIDDQISDADADYRLNPVWDDFDILKAQYFSPKRAPYYHYCVWTQYYGGPTNFSSGVSRDRPASDFVISLHGMQGNPIKEAGTFMHELGHNLGLHHGGNDERNRKPNYISVMSYAYQLSGLRRDGMGDVIDYSRFRLRDLDEASLGEWRGLQSSDGTPSAEIDRYEVRVYTSSTLLTSFWSGPAGHPIDWDHSGEINYSYPVSTNIDGKAEKEVLSGHDDWDNLRFWGGSVGSPEGQETPGLADSPTGAPSITSVLGRPVDFPPIPVNTPQQGAASRRFESLSTGPLQPCPESEPAERTAEFANAHMARSWRAAR